jgi:hypothetical protein
MVSFEISAQLRRLGLVFKGNTLFATQKETSELVPDWRTMPVCPRTAASGAGRRQHRTRPERERVRPGPADAITCKGVGRLPEHKLCLRRRGVLKRRDHPQTSPPNMAFEALWQSLWSKRTCNFAAILWPVHHFVIIQ